MSRQAPHFAVHLPQCTCAGDANKKDNHGGLPPWLSVLPTMTKGEMPAEVRRFILTSIPSVPYLEAVLLLRAEPGQPWDAARLARRLYVPDRTAGDLLELLRTGGVATADPAVPAVRYAPAPELALLLDGVALAYAADLLAVTDLIHSRIDKRAQQFADAFRFRKE
jgi:hypothetical protein